MRLKGDNHMKKSIFRPSFFQFSIPQIFCFFFIFFHTGFKAQAQQNECNCSILESKNLYNVGLFKELRQKLNCCLENPNKSIKIIQEKFWHWLPLLKII